MTHLDDILANLPSGLDRALLSILRFHIGRESAGGRGGGYYIARNWQELEDFIGQELRPRAMDLLEQEKALKVGAKREFGENSTQLGLI